ncbi:PEP-CTERM protein-sorting domain-containing protein [Marininema mesophilum]|uniref:PEP-CTERM protein-sorting domain-containing protein n=1 Tax=Marininema mesophilum TaxID=1048340 RepID=A0A1H3BTX0_9BACL|nr:hypothetical protein [Marininema mesophilum]SDX45333.1 PEP-CTERM protein-sorting domain-containing protein [Marininema mesophilum]
MNGKPIKIDANDCLMVVGLGFLGVGLWMIYPPSAWILLGLALGTISLLRSR